VGQALAACRTIILSFPTSDVVKEVLAGMDLKPGTTIVDTTTGPVHSPLYAALAEVFGTIFSSLESARQVRPRNQAGFLVQRFGVAIRAALLGLQAFLRTCFGTALRRPGDFGPWEVRPKTYPLCDSAPLRVVSAALEYIGLQRRGLATPIISHWRRDCECRGGSIAIVRRSPLRPGTSCHPASGPPGWSGPGQIGGTASNGIQFPAVQGAPR